MGLRTERGSDRLPDDLLAAAENLVAHLRPSQYSKLYHLASNARHQILGSRKEWSPFKPILEEFQIERTDRNHATALILALMPRVLEKKRPHALPPRQASKRMERTRKKGEEIGRRDPFAVSKASSRSIENAADRFPLALERLAKK